jgi:hypothetical protein
MSRRSPLAPILIGVAIGATAAVIYNRRSLLAIAGAPGRPVLPPGSRALSPNGGLALQNVQNTATSVARSLSTALQGGPSGLIEQAQRYIQTARAQLDVAIAEGQVAAAQTRKELEERFAAAKTDPASARSAFM